MHPIGAAAFKHEALPVLKLGIVGTQFVCSDPETIRDGRYGPWLTTLFMSIPQ
jgi:hypothetical protein